ncbi:helix-turn-helix transcriptional regulator [Streptomyces sp. NPDC093149]|uniref:helix-turn-helix domain-containing protein n=1 Tax=Streptomyces sp. NPDC093149 TaxID=3366031 RepID=UPI00381455DB
MNAPFDLSPRRREAAALNAVGLTPEEIADELGITTGGVRSHLRDAQIRLGVKADRPLTYLLLAGGGVDLSRLRTPLFDPVDELTRPTRPAGPGCRPAVSAGRGRRTQVSGTATPPAAPPCPVWGGGSTAWPARAVFASRAETGGM